MISHSPEQLAFFSEVTSGSSSILLEAVAGSGKTTTIVHATTLIPKFVLTVMLAFNKRIADELQSRIPVHCQSGTFHSRAFRALQRHLPNRPKVEGDKTKLILKKLLKYKDQELYSSFVMKLVSYAKAAGLGTEVLDDSDEAWQKLISHFSLTLDSLDADPKQALAYTQQVFRASCSDTQTIDFDDMLYFALKLNVRFDLASFLIIDEAQDTNSVQRRLAHKMLAPSGRLLAVGDPRQSIYGFRGADASAMTLLASEFSMLRMPLSVSFRCSKAVVAEAQRWLDKAPL